MYNRDDQSYLHIFRELDDEIDVFIGKNKTIGILTLLSGYLLQFF